MDNDQAERKATVEVPDASVTTDGRVQLVQLPKGTDGPRPPRRRPGDLPGSVREGDRRLDPRCAPVPEGFEFASYVGGLDRVASLLRHYARTVGHDLAYVEERGCTFFDGTVWLEAAEHRVQALALVLGGTIRDAAVPIDREAAVLARAGARVGQRGAGGSRGDAPGDARRGQAPPGRC